MEPHTKKGHKISPYGTGGWLAFYILLGFISVGNYLYRAYLVYVAQSAIMLPLFFELAHFVLAFLNAFTCLWLLLQKPKAAVYVKNYLLAAAVYFGIMTASFIVKGKMVDLMMVYIFGVLINIVWYQYFDQSKRIKHTFPNH